MEKKPKKYNTKSYALTEDELKATCGISPRHAAAVAKQEKKQEKEEPAKSK